MTKVAASTIPPSLKDSTVEDFWDENNGWKWELFSYLLLEEALKSIAACEVTKGDECEHDLI